MTDFNATSAATLTVALAAAVGGDNILLAAGNYGTYTITKDATGSPIVIKALNPATPPVFDFLYINGATLITIEDVRVISANPNTMTDANGQIEVYNGSNQIILRRVYCKIYDNASGYQIGRNILLDFGCTNITIDACELVSGQRGVVAFSTAGLTITDTEIYDAREGINFPGCSTVLFDNNYIHDFRCHPELDDHADMMQCWTLEGSFNPATNVTITDNVLDIGAGSWSQSMFFRNEWVEIGGGSSAQFYQSWTISRNHIRNAHTHGITMGEVNGLLMEDNIVQWVLPNMSDPYNADPIATPNPSTDAVWVPKVFAALTSTSVTVQDNTCYAAPQYSGSRFSLPVGATASNNVTLKDSAGPTPSWGGGGGEPALPVITTTTITMRVTV